MGVRSEGEVSSGPPFDSYLSLLTVTELHIRKHAASLVPSLTGDDSVRERSNRVSRSSHCEGERENARSAFDVVRDRDELFDSTHS